MNSNNSNCSNSDTKTRKHNNNPSDTPSVMSSYNTNGRCLLELAPLMVSRTTAT
jgi:hypothetical protein